jgi:beta-lactamase class A
MPMILPILAAAALSVLAAGTPVAPPPPPPAARLEALNGALRTIAEENGGSVGVSVLHLETGASAGIDGSGRFQMASVFKLPVAIAVLRAVDAGTLGLDTLVEIRPEDRRKIGPLDDSWTPGMKVSVARMLDVMLVDSDNTAADKLIAMLGGPPAVQKSLEALGVRGISISLDENGMDAAIRKDLAAFEAGAVNGATPDAMATLLARLWRGELLPAAGTARILDAMRRCRTGDKRLRAGLPAGTEVFDKTGTVRSCANHVGVVTLPDRSHLVVAVFVRGGGDAAAREATIARVARTAWGAFATSN